MKLIIILRLDRHGVLNVIVVMGNTKRILRPHRVQRIVFRIKEIKIQRRISGRRIGMDAAGNGIVRRRRTRRHLYLVVVVAIDFEVRNDKPELLLGLADKILELTDQTQAAGYRKAVTDGGLVDDRLHSGESLVGLQLLEKLKNVTHTEQTVCILKHFGLIRWEIWRQRTV